MNLEVVEGVGNVTFSHPPHNLVDASFVADLERLLGELSAGINVVVFRSADPDFFLMHGDVEALAAIPVHPHRPATGPNVAAALFQRLHTAPFVTIGVLDGAARGGGAELLTALDLRFVTPRSVLGQPEVPLGILPGAGGTARLPRLLGRAAALDVILTGRDVGAEEALALGWVDAVAPLDELEDRVRALAGRIAVMPPESVGAVKQVVDVSLGALDAALTAESDALGRLLADGRQVEPMRRFLAAGGQTREAERDRMAELL